MHGLMMQLPLLISSLIRHADRYHGDTEIVSRRVEGDIHRYTYTALHGRARRMANALSALGVARGDRIASLAWNGYRHLELYYAVSGMGAVMHTINPRLHADHIAWIANHAEDCYLFFDVNLLPVVAAIAPHCRTVKAFVAMVDADRMPAHEALPRLLCYEELIAGAGDRYDWPELDENSASSLCYTSGTTGHPKGALYSHRSTILHSYGIALPDSMGLSARDAVLPIVPMFHVNAWGLPYAAPMVGAKLVLPGPHLDGKSLHELFEGEKVTFSAGVPTVYQGLLAHLHDNDLRLTTMRRCVIGGSACSPAMLDTFEDRYGVTVLHGWGMTEMSPVGSIGALKAKHLAMAAGQRRAVQYKQGRPYFGVDMRIADDAGNDQPWDGKAFGNLLVRGPSVLREYFKGEGGDPLVDGWFPTGDVATLDGDGYMHITDRSKDVIKSGGEWISSIELENIAMSHPDVAMAACVAAKHPKWDERPLLVVMKRPGRQTTREAILAHYEGKVPRWQVPDDVVFVDSIPLGATGKVLKSKLREQFENYRLPE